MSNYTDAKTIVGHAEALIEIIQIENTHLQNRETGRLADTQDRKQELVKYYADGIALLKAGKVAISGTDRTVLMDTGQKLEATMSEHGRRVARMKSITEGMLHTVAEHAEKRQAPTDGYGAHGQTQAATLARNAYRRPTALSVNRMI